MWGTLSCKARMNVRFSPAMRIYARLVEGEDGAHNLIWSRSKGD